MRQWLKQWVVDGLVVAKLLLVLAVPTGLLLVHVWHQYQIAELGYEIAEETTEHRELLEENKKLVVEARLQGRSDRVSEVAERHFGLQQPRPEQVITVDEISEPAPRGHARADTVDSDPEPAAVR